MATVLMLTEFFLMALAFGVGAFSFLADTRETGAGFLRIVMSICGGSSLIALILHLTYGTFTDPQSFMYYIALLCFVLIYFFHQDKKSPLMWVLFAVHNIAFTLLVFLINNSNWEQFFFALTSILFLGSVTYAMVMGHWYLVTPKLSEKPLKIALYFTWAFFIIKVGFTVISYLEAGDFFAVNTMAGGGYAFNWMMLAMRVGWGYIVLGIMSYFAYKLIAMRSIQSATGMLYAMTFFVFVSELISNYMFFEYGLYI